MLDDLDLWAASNTDWLRFSQIDLTQWQPPLPGHTDASGQVRSFLGRFGRTGGDTGTAEINRGQYVSFRIDTTGHANRAGQLSWEQPGSAGAPLLVTLSPCPGDFFPTDSRCKSNGSAASGLGWTSGVPASNYCPLTVGTVWYLNVVFGSPSHPGQTTCPFAQCRWLFTQSWQAGCATP
ncbi:MAG: hypothetical protein IPK97_08395 [Ahniella sp.]|nr:hypothetical protein [Ahniella sp.]